MNLEVGSTVGDYQVVGVLGAGGMGKVYQVRNTISERIEAMKVLLPDLATEADLADRFLREIKVQASLEHPNIAALHTAVRVENQLLMLMECLDGVTLEQKLQAGPLAVADAVNYVRQVLSALEYAHGRGVIHRDIKPANMMLTPGGVVKLMDFGIAKAANDRRLTMTGTTMGSLYYMSPEQIQGSAGLDPRSDLYSLGVSLYEMVTGKHPFDGDSQFAIMSAHLETTPVPPIEVDPKLPKLLSDVILMSVAKDPAARFQSAAALRTALANVGIPTATVAAPIPVAKPATAVLPVPSAAIAPRGSRRGLWMALGAVATALALVGVVEFGPKIGGKAAQEPVPVAQPAVTPPQQQQAPPPQSEPDAQIPATAPAPSAAPEAAPQKHQHAPLQSISPAAHSETPVQQSPIQQPAAQPQPVQQPPVQQPASPLPAAPQPDEATRAALQQVRLDLAMLQARATGIRATLQRLESAQSANGMGLNASLQEPAHLMNTFLDEAANAVNSGDAASAKSFQEKAERQIEILEKRLNR